jgi:DNA-binding NarL/FixJ family response regulator
MTFSEIGEADTAANGGVIRLMVEHTDNRGNTTLVPLSRETQFVIAANLMRTGGKGIALSSDQLPQAPAQPAPARGPAFPRPGRTGGLTRRELQVFDLLVSGMSNKLIAHELSISPRTVEIHRAHVMRKLKVPNVAGLVRVALNQYLPNAA